MEGEPGSTGLAALLADAERAQLQLLGAIPDRPERVAQLKDAVLFLLDVLVQVQAPSEQREVLAALRRVFSPCAAYLYDARAFLDDAAGPSASCMLMSPRQGVKRGNVVLKALLGTITALSSRSTLPTDMVRGLIDMVHELCAQSIDSADVVMLFDFLRLGQPPARSWLLQAQRALVERQPTPRAIFAMQGDHAGIIAPSHQALLTKKGYTCSFGIRLDPGSPPAVALYSFRGQNGHGVSALLDGNTLVIKTHSGQTAAQQVDIPFTECRARMVDAWVHLCVVHAKKMVFKDKVTVFVDGKPVFNGNLAYPDPVNLAGGQNSIGVMPSTPGVQGKLWSPTLFGLPLSEAEVQKLHWLTHWKSDLSSVAAENAGLTDKSKFIFSYDARNCDLDRRICHDVSGNECHGWLEPGTRTYVTQNFVQALDSIGGCACFLLLLLDQIPEMADFHPKTEFCMEEISDLLAFVGTALRCSIECRAHFARLQGVKVVEFVLQSISPSYLSVDLLESIVCIIEALVGIFDKDDALLSDYIHRLLFFNPNWFLSPFETQVKLLDEVLPKYLQLIQDHRTRQGSAAGTGAGNRTNITQLATWLNGFERPADVDVDFFCNLIVQVYLVRESADGEQVTTAQMDVYQLKHLRVLIMYNLIGRLLASSPSTPTPTLIDNWEQLFAHICRRSGSGGGTPNDCADVEEILSYLTRVLNSDPPNGGAQSAAPLTRQQLTSAICRLSKGSLRVLWRPMLSAVESVRLAALRFFESYVSDKVLLRRRDVLMLCSALQAHALTTQTADLLLNVLIGRCRSNQDGSSFVLAPRAVTMARLEFIPMLLLGLIHNAESLTQLQILAEIKLLLLSQAVSDTVKEAIRSWPPWLNRLRAVSLRASEQHRYRTSANPEDQASLAAANSEEEAQRLNGACIALSDDNASADAKLDALQSIAASGDLRGCDFALSVLQTHIQQSKSAAVARAIMDMVMKHFPQRSPVVITKLANQLIVDVVVYSILNVRNGWMHALELFYYHSKHPTDLCALVSAVCEQSLQRVNVRTAQVSNFESTTWENLSQVAAIVSQSDEMVATLGLKLGIREAVLSSGQQQIFARHAFDLWQVVVSHLDEIKWDDMVAHLSLNANFGSDVRLEEKALFCNLVASHDQPRDLALQSAVKYLRFADLSSPEHAWDLVSAFTKVLANLHLLPASHLQKMPVQGLVPSRISPNARSTMNLGSTPTPRPSLHASSMTATSNLSGSLSLLDAVEAIEGAADGRFRAHLAAIDASFGMLDKHLKVESASTETARQLVCIMVALSISALQALDNDSADELVKALQIIASTDVEFFCEISQIQELVMLWRLHWDSQPTSDISSGSSVASSPSEFLIRWEYVIEHHSLEFNPFLIQKHAAIQAETLGNELCASEGLWKEILDRSDAESVAKQSRDEADGEPRIVQLKLDIDKFASSIHKLITRSSMQNALLDDHRGEFDSSDTEGATSQAAVGMAELDETKEINNASADTGPLLKVSSRENGFRMRLRLKEVPQNYRIRNLSCECAGSGFLDTESRGSGKLMGRRFRGSLDRYGGDLEKSWRSDADSDYSDFLADAQMRAAIIRSSSNVDVQGSPMSDGFSDDELDGADDNDQDELESELRDDDYTRNFFDADEEAMSMSETKAELSDEALIPRTVDDFITTSSPASEAPSADESPAMALESVSQPISIPVATVPSPSTSAASSLKSIASSPYSFGASVLSAVGGMAGLVHKAAKDAKDAVEYGVDSLYTAKDAFSEEAQSLIQEVSIIMETNAAESPHESLNATSADSEVIADPSAVNTSDATADAQSVQSSSSSKDHLSSLKSSQLEKSTLSSRPPLTPTSIAAPLVRSKREMEFRAKLVRHMHVVEGRLLLSDSQFGFIAVRVVDEHDVVVVERRGSAPIDKPWRFLFKNRRWRIDDICGLHRRRYLLKPTALEIFIQSTRKNYFFNFAADDVTQFHEALMARRPLLLKRDPAVRRLRHPSSIFRNSNMSARWVNHEISTFEYLMWLNTIAGRTYNDLTQYPVFPWIIADYESSTLDLSRRSTYRDLSKPMGALEPIRLKSFLDRYEAFDDPDIPKFM